MLHKIDLVSAYLVLHGILPREAATPLGDGATKVGPRRSGTSATSGETPEETTPSDVKLTSFDPGYCEAIENGYLTFQQAVERGDRVAFATDFSRRHDLEMDLAFMVADNVIGLDEALRRKAAQQEKRYVPPPVPSSAPEGRRSIGVPLLLVLVALGGWVVWSRESGGEAESRRSVPRAASAATPVSDGSRASSPRVEFLVDESGALTEVWGPDPASVLGSFCSHPWNASRYVFQSIAPGVVPNVAERVGIMRDRDRGSVVSVLIARDPRSRRWHIGSGQGPITFLEGSSAGAQ
jgi:hypothetical protein